MCARESWRLRAAPECLIGFHFLGGLMSFQNLPHTPKSTRRVAHLSFSRKVLSYRAERIEKKKKTSRRWNKLKKLRTSLPETKQKDFNTRNTGTRAPLSAGKGGWTFFFFFFNCNHEKWIGVSISLNLYEVPIVTPWKWKARWVWRVCRLLMGWGGACG